MPAVINLHVETKWCEKTEPKKKKRKENNLDSADTKKNGDVLSAAALIPEQRERASKTPIKPPTE